jgi:hypothetical protein
MPGPFGIRHFYSFRPSKRRRQGLPVRKCRRGRKACSCASTFIRYASCRKVADRQWDFSAAQLHRPRHHHANSSHHRIAGSTVSLSGTGAGAARSQSNLPLANASSSTNRGRYHPAPPRSEVALLQPVMVCLLHPHLYLETS